MSGALVNGRALCEAELQAQALIRGVPLIRVPVAESIRWQQFADGGSFVRSSGVEAHAEATPAKPTGRTPRHHMGVDPLD